MRIFLVFLLASLIFAGAALADQVDDAISQINPVFSSGNDALTISQARAGLVKLNVLSVTLSPEVMAKAAPTVLRCTRIGTLSSDAQTTMALIGYGSSSLAALVSYSAGSDDSGLVAAIYRIVDRNTSDNRAMLRTIGIETLADAYVKQLSNCAPSVDRHGQWSVNSPDSSLFAVVSAPEVSDLINNQLLQALLVLRAPQCLGPGDQIIKEFVDSVNGSRAMRQVIDRLTDRASDLLNTIQRNKDQLSSGDYYATVPLTDFLTAVIVGSTNLTDGMCTTKPMHYAGAAGAWIIVSQVADANRDALTSYLLDTMNTLLAAYHVAVSGGHLDNPAAASAVCRLFGFISSVGAPANQILQEMRQYDLLDPAFKSVADQISSLHPGD